MNEDQTEICMFMLDPSNKNSRITTPPLMLKLLLNEPLEKHLQTIDDYYREYVSAFLAPDSMRLFGSFSAVDTALPLYLFLDRSKRLPIFTVKYEQSLNNSEAKRAGWRKRNRIVVVHRGIKMETEKDCSTVNELLKKLKISDPEIGCMIGRRQIPSTCTLADLEKYKHADSNIYIRVDNLNE
jgi:hypothetical protein